eukprot:438779_1
MISSTFIIALLAVNYAEQYKLILRHEDTKSGMFSLSLRTTQVENEAHPNANTYSIIGNLIETDYQSPADSNYQFKLIYYNMDGTTSKIVWKQSSWLTHSGVSGYSPISVPEQNTCAIGNGCRFQGLGFSSHDSCTFLDGDAHGTNYWWNSVGTICTQFNDAYDGNGIPAFDFNISFGQELYVMDFKNNGNKCNKDTDISNLGSILCHYSSVNIDGGFTGSKWFDISGNGNDLEIGRDFEGLSYLGSHAGLNEDYVSNHPSTSGYIKFPTECNLPADGDYTLFHASMYYGAPQKGSRAFGNCLDNTFISGWYQQNEWSSSDYDWPIHVYRDGYQLHEENYNINGWALVSDTMNSFRLNGREITHEIPVFDKLGNNDIQICFNYVNGESTYGPYRIKEYIVFDETLDNDEQRCVEEYIFDKHDFWQHLNGLAPKQN